MKVKISYSKRRIRSKIYISVLVDHHDCFCIRVLCETVKDFVSKIGTASANSDPSEADEPDSLAQKVGNLD